jgi:hypothetical protein
MRINYLSKELKTFSFLGVASKLEDGWRYPPKGSISRRYWLSLDAAKFDKFDTVGHMQQRKDKSLCVVHVQYSGTIAVSSKVSRVALRPTQTIELRAHRNKCNPCRQCQQRRDCQKCRHCSCPECERSVDEKKFTKCEQHCSCLECARILDEKKFTKCKNCPASNPSHFDCDHCRDFKWAKSYGKQLRLGLKWEEIGPNEPETGQEITNESLAVSLQKKVEFRESELDAFEISNLSSDSYIKVGDSYFKPAQLIEPHGGLEHIFQLDQQSTWHMLPLNDTKQRRFALLIGNSEYVQPVQPLENAVADVEALAEKLRQPHIGFKVNILRNKKKDEIEDCVCQWAQSLPEDAIALLDLSGHGRELRGEKYFVPIDCNESMHDCSDDDVAVVRKVKTNFVELRGVLTLLHRVLRRDALMITFWDCCRENDLRDRKNIWRGPRQFDPLIRGEKAFEDHLDQLSSPDDPGQIVVCASLPSCLAFDGSDESSHGPFTTALLEVLQDTELLAKDILDSSVKQHIIDTIRKITGGNQVPEFFEKRTEQTFKFLEQADSDGAPSASTAGPFGFSGSGPTKGTAQPQPKRQESKERPQVEVSYINKKTQDLVKADGSPLDRPDDAPWPFTILFVGVDNGEKTDPDLHLQREFERIEQAYREARVSKVGSSSVLIKWLRFSKWAASRSSWPALINSQ